MLVDAWSEVFTSVEGRLADGAFLRVRVALEDVDTLSVLHALASDEARDLLLTDSEETIAARLRAGARADTLHRAVVDACHRALMITLHEIHARPARGAGLTAVWQLEQPVASRFEHKSSWEGLACLTIYRNKIVAHHDVARMGASTTDEHGLRRLVPLPEGFNVEAHSFARLRTIRDSTGIAFGVENYFQLLEALFYGLHFNFGGRRSVERREVESIAELGGVASPTVPQLRLWLADVLPDLAFVPAGR